MVPIKHVKKESIKNITATGKLPYSVAMNRFAYSVGLKLTNYEF